MFVGLGSNLGDRLGHIRRAVEKIALIGSTRVVAVSSVYETQPRLYGAQPDFLNACARLETALKPHALLDAMQDIEAMLGRKRLIPNGPRTVDLDLLLYADEVINDERLSLPHPGLARRAFVLVPLVELLGRDAPSILHPQLGRSMAELLQDCPDRGWVRRVGALT